jgi:choline-sulfatase
VTARGRAALAGAVGASVAVAIAIALGAAAPPQPRTAPAPARPDVLLVTIDTLRPDALGWVAGRNATPEIDALAKEGFRFPAAVSPVPLTLPSHTSILSGRLPRRHGVRDNGEVVGGDLPLLAERLRQSGYATAAFVSGYPLRAPFGLDRGFDVYDDHLPVGEQGWLERPAEATARAAGDWLDKARSPWFLWVHFYDPHDPYEPPRAFWQPGPRGRYDGEVAYVDFAIGELRKRLARHTGPRLTVLTADHGEGLNEHGEAGHGFFVYDTTVVVPLVIALPGRVAAGQSAAPARLIDVAPTVLDLLGLPALAGADGTSLRPLFSAPQRAWPAAYVESRQPWTTYGWAPLAAWRERDWKLIQAPRPELYDLRRDPAEASNRIDADRPRARTLRQAMQAVEREPARQAAASTEPQATAALRALGYLGSSTSQGEPPPGLPDPKDRLADRAALLAGENLLRAGQHQEAIARFEQVLKNDPKNRFATLRTGMAWLEAGKPERAVPFLERALALDPEQAEAQFALADAYVRVGRLNDSLQHWMETVRLQPRRAAAWSNLGTTLGRLGKASDAVTALRRAVAAEPGNAALHNNLGRALLGFAIGEAAAGRREEARRAVAEALREDPSLRAVAAGDARLAPLL